MYTIHTHNNYNLIYLRLNHNSRQILYMNYIHTFVHIHSHYLHQKYILKTSVVRARPNIPLKKVKKHPPLHSKASHMTPREQSDIPGLLFQARGMLRKISQLKNKNSGRHYDPPPLADVNERNCGKGL